MKEYRKRRLAALTAIALAAIGLLSACGQPDGLRNEPLLPDGLRSEPLQPDGLRSEPLQPENESLRAPQLSDTLKNRWYISRLNTEQLINFSQLYDAVTNFRQECRFFGDITEEDARYLVMVMLNDCPEIFQLDDASPITLWSLNDAVTGASFHYVMDEETYHTNLAACQTVIDALVSEANGKTDLEKEMIAYDYLVENCIYDENGPFTGTAFGALVRHSAKCDGFSRAMLWLAEAMDMNCLVMTGSDLSGVGHAWNCISVDGQFYHLDVTADAQSVSEYGFNLYPAFNIPASWMLRAHVISDEILACVTLPDAEGVAQNYHFLHGDMIASKGPCETMPGGNDPSQGPCETTPDENDPSQGPCKSTPDGNDPSQGPYETALDAGLARLKSENPITMFFQFESEADYITARDEFADVLAARLRALNRSCSCQTITSDAYCLICVTVDAE